MGHRGHGQDDKTESQLVEKV